MSRNRNLQLPRQKLPYKQKSKEWRKDNLDYADRFSFYNDEELRKSIRNKLINLNLYNGVVDVNDMMGVLNPSKTDASYVDDNIPHHPIIVPKIDLLVGEEIARPFDFNVVVTDPNSVSMKMEARKQFWTERIVELLQQNYSDEELEQKMEELGKYMKYSWKDLREKMANQILNYYWNKEKFKEKFTEGFKDALIMAEEIYAIDVVHDEPILTKLNPLKVRAVRSGNSERFEDASIIIIEDYKSPAQLIDEYYDELKSEDINYLEDYSSGNSGKGEYRDDFNHAMLRDGYDTSEVVESMFKLAEFNGHIFGSDHTDEFGNIRELKVRWKSLRKVKRIKYYDEFGAEQFRFESEEYKTDKLLGEEESVMWINEAWEGVKLGKDIYLKMRPLPVQYVSATNPSKCHLGIIGQIYSTGQGKAVSILDRSRNYQYMYNVVWDRLNKAIATNYGKILELDLSKIPAGWEIDKWMHFAVVNKIAVVDAFKEGNHGAATGKLAGSMNTMGGRSIDMDNGNYIQQHVQLLEFIKMEMSDIVGVTKQREGQISNRETVGGVERSVNQSSHITEYWYMKHDQLKVRVLTAFLEAAKFALRQSGNKIVQYVLDDQSIEILNMDSEMFVESDYGITITNSAKYAELEQILKQNAQAMLQNGGSITTLLDIMFSPSLMDMRRKMEQSEEDAQRRSMEQQQMQQQQMRQQMEQMAAIEQAKQELEKYKIDEDNATKRYVAELSKGASEESGYENTDENNPLDKARFELDVVKAKADQLIKIQTLAQDMIKHNDNVELKKESNAISRIKKKSTT